MYVSVDNSGFVYTNRAQMFYVPGFAKATVSNVTAPGVLAINITNIGGPGGFAMSTTFGGCITNSTKWKCSTISYTNWTSITFNDSSWSSAVSYSNNAAGLYPKMSSFSNNCSYVGFLNYNYVGNVYCRLSLC